MISAIWAQFPVAPQFFAAFRTFFMKLEFTKWTIFEAVFDNFATFWTIEFFPIGVIQLLFQNSLIIQLLLFIVFFENSSPRSHEKINRQSENRSQKYYNKYGKHLQENICSPIGHIFYNPDYERSPEDEEIQYHKFDDRIECHIGHHVII